MLMAILSVLPPVYLQYLKDPEEWWHKVLAIKDKMSKFGAKVHIEEMEESDKGKVVQERVLKKLKLWRVKAELEKLDEKRIIADTGFPDTSRSS